MRSVSLIRLVVLVLLAAPWVSAPLARAAYFPLSDRELLAASDLVVDAIVREQTSHWNEDHSLIFTTVTLDVLQTLYSRRASAGQVVRIVVLGGEVGDVGLVVEDTPRFRVGERAVVFIAPWTKGRNVVAGGELGWIAVDPSGRLIGRAISVDGFAAHLRMLSR